MLDLDPPADMLDSSAALALGAGGKPPAAHQKLMAWQARTGLAPALEPQFINFHCLHSRCGSLVGHNRR